MKRVSIVLLVSIALLGSLTLLGTGADAGPNVVTLRYVGDINGAKAYAIASFERVYDYVVMAGRIESGRYVYTFKADIVGSSGYGDMLDNSTNSRFRIHVQITPIGFNVTSNPFGPGTLSTYIFKRY